MMSRRAGLDGITSRNEEVHWRMQSLRTVGSALTVVVLSGALAGVFGSGPLSSSEIAAGDLKIEYPRFARWNATLELVFHVVPPPGANSVAIRISNQYLRRFHVEGISPPPSQVRSDPGGSVYVFDARAPALVKFSMRPEEFGLISGDVRTSGSGPLMLNHLIYP